MRVAVLGLGEAGSRLAADLVAAGVDVHGYDPVAPSTPDGVGRVEEPAATVARSDLVLSLTAARAALDALEAVLSSLPAGAVYADLNTGSPELKRELAGRVEATGGRFAERRPSPTRSHRTGCPSTWSRTGPGMPPR
jgi:3-hydroxyisobutyrate dehydrogenase-like beta-hydroxyacid dehydrogenase